jgi:hypothetical protein
MPVNTAKVTGRRKVEYASFDELLADADRIGTGSAEALGNWSAGQIFRHLAAAYNSSIDGFTMVFPWYVRVLGKIFRNKLVSGAMPPGLKLPNEGSETLRPGPTSTEEGLAELHAAVVRLQREPRRASHPVFGTMSKEEWDKVHLKHASLHMSFLVPN